MFAVVTFFNDVRVTFYFGTFELRMEITLQLRFVFFVIVTYFLLRLNYVIYSFAVVTFFDSVRITLYFGTYRNYVIKWSFLVTFVCNQKMTKNYVIIT